MSPKLTITYKIGLLLAMYLALGNLTTFGQEAGPDLSSNNTYHNQLFFNRFLINPTYSLVRENKSYLNILHRNQYATFEDNRQIYFLGFSNKLNENTAVGIGVYSQWSGVIQEFGFNANYAKSVQMGAKSKLTFGTNVTYFNEGLDKNRVVAEENDPELMDAKKESKIAIQPGVTLSMGRFDVGFYAEDLVKYNQSTNEFLTSLNSKNIKATFQYTHPFMARMGLFSNARLMPLLQIGQNIDGSLAYVGSFLLDMPKFGWLQSTFDDTYGLSMGFGFNLSKQMSLGYLLEKDLMEDDADLGWNHELSLAYTFKGENGTTAGMFADNSEDARVDRIVRNYEEQILALTAEKDKEKDRAEDTEKDKDHDKGQTQDIGEISDGNVTDALAYQNRLILDELILRQDSIENARNADIEKRFETLVRFLRSEIKQGTKPPVKDFNKIKNTALADNKPVPKAAPISNTVNLQKYEKLPIKVLRHSDIVGVKSGYYIIANVYKTKKYKDAFMKDLKDKGLDAKEFFNKENGLYYVYLADYNFKQEAETAYVSDLNGQYQKEKWIMQVDSPTATASNLYEDEDAFMGHQE